MTNRHRQDPAESSLLGMIVDRSSFDEDERDDDLLSLAEESRRRTRNGKVRRKLRWKPAAFRSKNNRPSNAQGLAAATNSSDAASVFSQRTNKSNASFHTFHSTETPVQSNQTTKKPIKLGRPHYRDTFEGGVSTIANEGHFIQAKTKASATTSSTTTTTSTSNSLQRSSTLPTTKTSSYDFQAMDGEAYYSADDLDAAPLVFDPFQLEQPTSKRPPRAVANDKQKQPSPGESPLLLPRKRPLKVVSPREAPEMPVAAARKNAEPVDAPLCIKEDLDDTLQVSYFKHEPPRSPSPPGNLGISPIKLPPHASPFVTPTKAGRPPKAPSLRFSSPLSPPKSLTPVGGGGWVTPQSLSTYMASSGQFQRFPMPDMPLTSAAAANQVRPALHLKLGSARAASATEDGHASPRKKDAPPPTARQSKTRNQTGPVDVDEGAFVEAEKHLQAIHDMATEHLAHGEYEEALEVFEEIFRGQLERYGADHSRVGTALHNIGIVHLKSGNYPKAVEICTLAVTIRKKALAPNHMDVAVSLAQLGVAHLECHNYRDALLAFRDALTIRRQVLGMKHPKVGKILNNIGCTLYELDELEGARLAFEEALDIQRESLRGSTIREDPAESKSSFNQLLLSVAATLCNIASIKVRWSRYDEASLALEEALLVSVVTNLPMRSTMKSNTICL